MEYDVTVQIAGEDVLAGRLYQNIRHGEETASFRYAPSCLDDARAFSLAPDMPLGDGSFHSLGLRSFGALEDVMPNRLGRNLLLRSERSAARAEGRAARTLFEVDMLIGVSDEARQGALRVWGSDGEALSSRSSGVPKEVAIPSLLVLRIGRRSIWMPILRICSRRVRAWVVRGRKPPYAMRRGVFASQSFPR